LAKGIQPGFFSLPSLRHGMQTMTSFPGCKSIGRPRTIVVEHLLRGPLRLINWR